VALLFDEFNRIDISAICYLAPAATYHKNARFKICLEFIFEGREIRLIDMLPLSL
jgi:hypothetical protein